MTRALHKLDILYIKDRMPILDDISDGLCMKA